MTGYDQLTGSVLHGTYRLVRLVGEGGMGTVYEAIHLRLDRRFAVKVLHRKASTNPSAVARFKREAQVTSKLGSQHIVDVIDFNVTQDGVPYLVMELLEGEDLETRLDRRGTLEVKEAATVFEQVAAALYSAHSKGIVHRDLKPSNIYLSRQEGGREMVKVLDFGISKILGDRQTAITTGSSIIGTPYYMAPEQVEEGGEVDFRTDVWAMGAIVYQMLAGRPPFYSSNIPTVLYAIVHEAHKPLGVHAGDLPPGLQEVVDRALGKRQDDRFPSIKAFWRGFAGAAGVPCTELSGTDSTDELGTTQPHKRPASPGTTTTLSTGTGETQQVPASGSRRVGVALAGGLVVAIAAAALLMTRGGGDGERQMAGAVEAGVRTPQAARRSVELGQTPDATQPRSSAVAEAPGPAPDAELKTPTPQDTLKTRGLWLRTTPSNARVRIAGGRVLGTTPLRGTAIGTGRVVLVISAPGHQTRRIPLREGHQPARLGTVALERLTPATLQLTVLVGDTPVPARIALDGKAVGEAPLVLKEVEPGPHVVEASRQGLGAVKRSVVLKPGQTHRVSLRLQ